ncbi:MAG: hypothetical protein DRP97_02435 [Candidatus Latescibacterota bacterium]|nr:MAG: hypothetical protein DRP97_02435 [Candidatus Latescibacterota bacterium]
MRNCSVHTLRLLLILSVFWLLPFGCWAAEVDVVSLERGPDGVFVDVEADGLFTEQSLDLLHRGFTAVVRYTVELWGARGNWFDRFLVRSRATVRIEFDLMETWYRVTKDVEGQERSTIIYEDLNDALAAASLLSGAMLPLSGRKRHRGGCYVAVWVESRALTTEDMKDMGRWLEGVDASGEGEKKDSSWLLETFLRLAGNMLASKHCQKARMQSEPFFVETLPVREGKPKVRR